MAMPRSKARVVCTLCEAIATLLLPSALINVDLPTLGAPMSAMNPQRLSARPPPSAIEAIRLHAGADQHGGGGGLLGSPFRAAEALGRREMGQLDGDAKLRIVVGSLALDFPVRRRRQAARLRPLLQHRLGVPPPPHPPPDEREPPWIPAAQEARPDQRLAPVSEDRGAAPPAGIDLRCSKPDGFTEVDRPRDVGASLLPHEVG